MSISENERHNSIVPITETPSAEHATVRAMADASPSESLPLEKHAVISTGIEITDTTESVDSTASEIGSKTSTADSPGDARANTHLPPPTHKRSQRQQIMHISLLI